MKLRIRYGCPRCRSMIGEIVYWLAIVAVIVVALNFIASFFVHDDDGDNKLKDDGPGTEQ